MSAPPPYVGTRIDRIGVVIPVHNEELALAACLDAVGVAASRVAVPATVIVVLDSCTDDSAAVVDGFSEGDVEALTVEANCVGIARAAGMPLLLRRHGQVGTWLATSDGDSMVPKNWLSGQLRHAGAGARVVAGTVTVEDWSDRNNAVRGRAQRDYCVAPHRHIHGANLAFAATAYCAAGGFSSVVYDEDVQLIEAFKANAEPITWATDLPVVTSARREARAPRGFAKYLTSLENALQPTSGS